MVKHSRDQVPAHSLPQRQGADGLVEKRPHLKQLDKGIEAPQVCGTVQTIEARDQLKGFTQWQVKPELRTLPKYRSDVARISATVLPRYDAFDLHMPGVGHEHTGEHLNGGRLAGAVGPKVPNNLPVVDPQRDVVDGTGHNGACGEEGSEPREAPLDPLGSAELLDQVLRLDHIDRPPSLASLRSDEHT